MPYLPEKFLSLDKTSIVGSIIWLGLIILITVLLIFSKQIKSQFFPKETILNRKLDKVKNQKGFK